MVPTYAQTLLPVFCNTFQVINPDFMEREEGGGGELSYATQRLVLMREDIVNKNI